MVFGYIDSGGLSCASGLERFTVHGVVSVNQTFNGADELCQKVRAYYSAKSRVSIPGSLIGDSIGCVIGCFMDSMLKGKWGKALEKIVFVVNDVDYLWTTKRQIVDFCRGKV